MKNKLAVLFSTLVVLSACGASSDSNPQGLWSLPDHPCDVKHFEISHSEPEFLKFENALKTYLATTTWGTPVGQQSVVTLKILSSINSWVPQNTCLGYYAGEVRVGGPFVFTNIYKFRAKLSDGKIVEMDKFIDGVTSN